MNIKGVPIGTLGHGLALYVRRRVMTPDGYLAGLLVPHQGVSELSDDQRRRAHGIDAMLHRLGVRCLWRAAVVTETLRMEGVAAQIRLAVSASDPRRAHAECEVGAELLRSTGDDLVSLR